MKVKKIDLIIFAIYIALFRNYYIPQVLMQFIKVFLLGIIILFFVSRQKIKKINIMLFYCFAMIFSSIKAHMDGILSLNNIFYGILDVTCIITIYFLTLYCKKHNYLSLLIRDSYYIVSFFCIFSIVSIILNGRSNAAGSTEYAYGSKFTTSYLFLYWLSLYKTFRQQKFDKYKRYRVLYFSMVVVIMFLCYSIQCATATIAAFFVMLDSLIGERIKNKLYNKFSVVILMSVAGSIPFFITEILKSKYIQNIILNVFHKSLNLSGRLVIYENILGLIRTRKWYGYGYGNVATTSIIPTIYNSQNGLMQSLLNYGVIGTLCFIILIFLLLSRNKHTDKTNSMYALLIGLIICSITEISYNYIFYFALFIIAGYECNSVSLMFDNKAYKG